MARTRKEDEKIFYSRLIPAQNGCLNWSLSIVNKGYGACWFQGKRYYVHRLAYYLIHGNIEPNHDIHHKCHNKLCCNIDHLEKLNKSIHATIDNFNSSKTHCPQDHEYNEKNTYIDKYGGRQCRICKNMAQRRYKGRINEQ